MSDWNDGDLQRIGDATELQVSSRRGDGTLRRFVTIWGVRAGDALYVRSAHGADNPWFRRAKVSGRGVVRADGVERDIRFEPADGDAHDVIDAAYHAKYDRYGPRIVGAVVGPKAALVTLRLVPEV